jgi:hypothetical protein
LHAGEGSIAVPAWLLWVFKYSSWLLIVVEVMVIVMVVPGPVVVVVVVVVVMIVVVVAVMVAVMVAVVGHRGRPSRSVIACGRRYGRRSLLMFQKIGGNPSRRSTPPRIRLMIEKREG